MFVIYEDSAVLVLNKPSGLVVNKSNTWKGVTLEDQIRDYLDLEDSGVGERAGIVHRLDKETSGLLVIAKKEAYFKDLQRQFKERQVLKNYLALCYGQMEPEKGLIDAPLARNPKNKMKMAVVEGGREAKTFYEVLDFYKAQNEVFSLVHLSPKTGRTHQLRVHLTALAHPLVGDKIYSGRKRYEKDSQWCPRLFLHAIYLEFNHPKNGERVGFEAPLPDNLQDVIDYISEE